MSDEPEILETEPVPRAAARAFRRRRRLARQRAGGRGSWPSRRTSCSGGCSRFFAWGGLSPLDTGVDLLVGFLMLRWMGWHLAFLPAFITELVPIANFVPSWTLAMWIVTRMRKEKS